ncbi:MAG: zf-HC2 domain-containing protein [Anaerolinea sp.]|nr:zf-HC2 domain-containing protein [Anaerolinea sp.]
MAETEQCKDLLKHFSAFVDGEASESLCADIERHLAACPECQIILDTLRRTISLYHDLETPTVPDSLRRKLLARFALPDNPDRTD